MDITGTITCDGDPLRGVFVKYDPVSLEPGFWTHTDDDGQVTLRAVDDDPARIRILSENPVVRMITLVPNLVVALRRRSETHDLSNNQEIAAGTSTENRNVFRLLQQFKNIYDRGLREFEPWDHEFPFSRDWDSNEKIEVMYPDNLPDRVGPNPLLAYVQPKGVFSGYPIIHMKDREYRTAAHELGHALHFGKQSEDVRREIQQKYVCFILHSGYHSFDGQSNPFVAFVEAFGHFAERYVNPHLVDITDLGTSRHRQFFSTALAELDANDEPTGLLYTPSDISGNDVEGAVFAALFVEYAQAPGIGLDFVVRTYVKSQALSFTQYAAYIRFTYGRVSRQYAALREAAARWGMPALRSTTVLDLVKRYLHKSPPISVIQDVFCVSRLARGQRVSLIDRLNTMPRRSGRPRGPH